MLTFRQIREDSPFPPSGYEIDVGLERIEENLEWLNERGGLVLDPDFQRGHKWTEAQQSAFVEYLMQGGPSARVIYWACEGWQRVGHVDEKVILVDGKQRLEACRKFMRGDLPVFGQTLHQYPDDVRTLRMGGGLRFNIADIDRAQTLKWYIALNSGGTPHTSAEIERVKALLAEELSKKGH